MYKIQDIKLHIKISKIETNGIQITVLAPWGPNAWSKHNDISEEDIH